MVLARFLYTPSGRVRTPRMIGTIAVTIVLAIFGSFLLAVTPVFEGHHGIQIAWVLFAVALLKLPLIGLLWWFIVRNKWPMKPPKWSEDEVREILAYLGARPSAPWPCPTRRPAWRTCAARPGTWPTGSAASASSTRSPWR